MDYEERVPVRASNYCYYLFIYLLRPCSNTAGGALGSCLYGLCQEPALMRVIGREKCGEFVLFNYLTFIYRWDAMSNFCETCFRQTWEKQWNNQWKIMNKTMNERFHNGNIPHLVSSMMEVAGTAASFIDFTTLLLLDTARCILKCFECSHSTKYTKSHRRAG